MTNTTLEPTQRSLHKVLDLYRKYLVGKVSKVRILGESDERDLKEVFVEVSVAEQHKSDEAKELLALIDARVGHHNPFANLDRNKLLESLEERQRNTKHRVSPLELLKRGSKAIVSGNPGCGKTTLLKYLALREVASNHLSIWVELKAINQVLFEQAKTSAAQNGNFILSELWLHHLKVQLSLTDVELKNLRAFWMIKFKANEISILLDGFDEVNDESIERNLNNSISEFTSAAHNNAILISTRPYAQHKLGTEYLQQFELEPLTQRQIEDFLHCYYPNDAAAEDLINTLKEKSSLGELLNVPLLLGVVLRLHREARFTNNRLQLYEIIVTDLVRELDRSKSVVRQFRINDERLRFDFLKFLAFDRLLLDQTDGHPQETNQIVFSYSLLKDSARSFLIQEGLSQNPRDLANDALATPLLREIGPDLFAFTHLTLQEYLCAFAFVTFQRTNVFEGLKIFFRAYQNVRLIEREVLPMTLGAMGNCDEIYAELEQWPESLTFANLRLRTRGLAYGARIDKERLSKLIQRLLEFASEKNVDETPYRDLVVNSYSGLDHQTMALIEGIADPLLQSSTPSFLKITEALGRIGSYKALVALTGVLKDSNNGLQASVGTVIGMIGSDSALQILIDALDHQSSSARLIAATALKWINSNKAIDALIHALSHRDESVRATAALSLGYMTAGRSVPALCLALNDAVKNVRQSAALVLRQIRSDAAIEGLILALKHEDSDMRRFALWLLEQIHTDSLKIGTDEPVSRRWEGWEREFRFDGSPEEIEMLVFHARSEKSYQRRQFGLEKLVETGTPVAVASLVLALKDGVSDIRQQSAEALANFSAQTLELGLARALADSDNFVRRKAASVLGYYSDDSQLLGQLQNLAQDKDSKVRDAAKEASRKFANKLNFLGYVSANSPAPSLSDNESKELFLIGEVTKIVAEAGHIFRPTSNNDWGIDGEIEFKNDRSEATGQRVYLQLKSGDSYLRKRKRDGLEIFNIKKRRHAQYWKSHAYPVLLVIQDSSRRIRWMNVTEYLHRVGSNADQIEFQGEPFTPEAVRQMRARFCKPPAINPRVTRKFPG